MRRAVLSAALAVACLVPAQAAASYDPLAAGATVLRFDPSFLTLLKRSGVELRAVAPATVKAGTVRFPVAGGRFDPVAGSGTVENEGAVVFQAGRRSLPLKALQVKTTRKHSPLSVKAGGGQLKLATAGSLSVTRRGFGERVVANHLALSGKVATRLGKKLHLEGVFEEGQALGASTTVARPQTIGVLGKGRVSLVLDPGFVSKLNSLFVAVNPIFPSEHDGPSFTLPIFGGTIAPDAALGRLEMQGSVEFLQLGGGQVFFHEPWLDLEAEAATVELDVEPSPPYLGKVGRSSVAGLSLGGAAVAANAKARTVSVASGSLVLTSLSADVFNQAFAGGRAVFVAGESLGSVAFTAQGQ